MAKKNDKRDRRMPVMRPHAAGMDIGAEEIYVAVPDDRDEDPVRCFSTFTRGLRGLADWLQKCGIETLAMEIDWCLLDSRFSDPGITRI